jgi:hypothetical protein
MTRHDMVWYHIKHETARLDKIRGSKRVFPERSNRGNNITQKAWKERRG